MPTHETRLKAGDLEQSADTGSQEGGKSPQEAGWDSARHQPRPWEAEAEGQDQVLGQCWVHSDASKKKDCGEKSRLSC